jgi:hypothetical protein
VLPRGTTCAIDTRPEFFAAKGSAAAFDWTDRADPTDQSDPPDPSR